MGGFGWVSCFGVEGDRLIGLIIVSIALSKTEPSMLT